MRATGLIIGIACLGMTALATAQPSQGPDFVVNAYTTNDQLFPQVARDANGNFVVVWMGRPNYAHGIFGRRFDSAGTPRGGDFQINTQTTGYPFRPDVAMRLNGDFVVVWSNLADSTFSNTPGSIRARRFDSAGDPLDSSEFQVNSYTMYVNSLAGYLSKPAVSSDDAGDFVVVWQSQYASYIADIRAKRFDSSGNVLGAGEVSLTTIATSGYGLFPEVAMAPSGDFVVVWDSYYDQRIDGLKFDSSGTPGSPFQVNSYTSTMALFPSVAMDGSGNFVVAWNDYGGAYNYIYARRFDSTGTPMGSDFQVASQNASGLGALLYGSPRAAANFSGGFVVVWSDYDQDAFGVFGRTFDSTGSPSDPAPFQVNTFTSGYQFSPDVALDDDGRFTVVWTSDIEDGNGVGVIGRQGCDDTDGDQLCDTVDILITSHMDGDFVDCSTPGIVSTRPLVKWHRGDFDKFRAMISWNPNFPKNQRIDSGPDLIRRSMWKPTRRQWGRACNHASPDLFIRVFGKDLNVRRTNPFRRTLSQVVEVTPAFTAPADGRPLR